MFRLFCALAFGLIASGFVFAQSSLGQYYDTSKPMKLSGTFSGSAIPEPRQRVPQHVYIFLNVLDANGKVERWAVEGNSMAKLLKEGYRAWAPTLRAGDITVEVYPSKPNADLVGMFPAAPPAVLRGVLERARAGRLVHGTEITLADGKKVSFGEKR